MGAYDGHDEAVPDQLVARAGSASADDAACEDEGAGLLTDTAGARVGSMGRRRGDPGPEVAEVCTSNRIAGSRGGRRADRTGARRDFAVEPA